MMNVFPYDNRVFAFFQRLVSLVRTAVSFFLGGETCVRCGERTLSVPLCRPCAALFARADFSCRCTNCGKPLVSEVSVCSACRAGSVVKSIDGMFPLHSYRFWRKSLLFEWKLNEKRTLSPFFSQLLARKIKELESVFGEIAIVPVPPRPGKIRKRGWDQVDELCYYLRRGWNFRVLPLLRRQNRVQQKKLGRTARIETIGSAYSLVPREKVERILRRRAENVLIIDDVVTTGSTLENCARSLRTLGFRKVFAMSIFVVD